MITQEKTTVHVRWMIRRDMSEILNIENSCFNITWGEKEFISILRKRNIIALVAEIGEKVIGFCIYELSKTKIRVLNFAIMPEYQRQKAGKYLIDKLKAKLLNDRNKIYVDVRENNLIAQLFFKSQEFKAIKVLNNYYDNDETAYRFKYKLPGV